MASETGRVEEGSGQSATRIDAEQEYPFERMWKMIPNRSMRGALRMYLYDGIPPGSFLRALLSNDFLDVFGRADSENLQMLHPWAMWVYNYMPKSPFTAHGSREIYNNWCMIGGLNGWLRIAREEAAKDAESG